MVASARRPAKRAEAGNADADDQAFAGPDQRGSGRDHRDEAVQVVRGHQRAFITGDGRHGRQRVHGLRAGNTRNAFDGHADDALGSHFPDHIVVDRRGRVDEGDEVLAFMHHVDLVLLRVFVEQRLFDLQDQFGPVIDFLRGLKDGRTCCGVGFVACKDAFACVVLHENGVAGSNVLLDGFRRCGDAVLVMHDLFRNSDIHSFPP